MFGPLGFAAYTEDVADVINWHSVLFQLYADDTQLHASSRLDDFMCLRQRLEACIAEFAQWCASRHLQLNADKTDVASWVHGRHHQAGNPGSVVEDQL